MTLIGAAIAAPTWIWEFSDATELRLLIVGYAFMILAGALGVMTDRKWSDRLISLGLTAALTWSVASKIVRERGVETDIVSAALIVVFFVVPLPLALAYFRNRQDELQRSLITNAAGVAFLATLFGSLGYAVLDALGGLEPLAPVAVPVFAVGTWVVAWVALRWRVA